MPQMRLQRALARAGISSRRKAEELIQAGRVSVNGSAASIGQSVDIDSDTIKVDGKVVRVVQRHTWLALNKPAGVLTAASDARGRRTIFDLIDDVPPGLTYVGRLDYLTEGLLLLTTDGMLAHRLTHPSTGIERTYEVTVRGRGAAALKALRAGVELEDGFARPRRVEAQRLERSLWLFQITLAEGRKREIRRMCEKVGLRVEKLIRTKFGPVQLGALPVGQTRSLSRREVQALEIATGTVG